ncbi:nuclear transport factor 2 family protein [Luteibacter aegosomaticola]|uniref:nuclear transport factor 2 family protein n=1 Tax=Luteibacter aegosomaticola TaxID=2911538 RepID=UPI001FF8BC82|nr:nuclear transport factor 2 family protein [Luteibacter aegosomaticola]UPG92104.1 nuclear transport factor 2 family protein [Luteibacter aegosomaticola]
MRIRDLAAAVCLLAAAPSLALAAAGNGTSKADEQAVLAPFQAFLDGMAKYDQAAMRATVQPEGSVALLRKDKVIRNTLSGFIDHIKPGKDSIEERIYEPLVRVDDNLAIIWARYDFRLNGKVIHCGTDLVHLVKQDGKWLIAGIADNSRDECPAG